MAKIINLERSIHTVTPSQTGQIGPLHTPALHQVLRPRGNVEMVFQCCNCIMSSDRCNVKTQHVIGNTNASTANLRLVNARHQHCFAGLPQHIHYKQLSVKTDQATTDWHKEHHDAAHAMQVCQMHNSSMLLIIMISLWSRKTIADGVAASVICLSIDM